MQTSPGDLKRIIAPAAGRKADIVFYFGCNVLRSPHLVFNVMDILDAIDVEYEVLGGTAHCCGVVHYLKGDAEVYGRMAGQTKANLDRMSAAKVLAWCPTCQLQFNNAYKTLSGSDESMGHITGFLASQLHRISPLVKHSIPKRAVIHEHGGMEGVVEATRSLMQAIPGLELVDVPQNRDFGYQCSRVVQHPEAQAEVHRVMAENAEKAGVDVIITIYHGCHRQLCGAEGQYNFEVKNFTDMLAEALGLGRTDHYKGYRTSGSILQAIESAEVFLKQNGVSLNSDQVELLKREIFGELGLGPTVEAPAELTYST
jgi:Fe-S oxidoreductase